MASGNVTQSGGRTFTSIVGAQSFPHTSSRVSGHEVAMSADTPPRGVLGPYIGSKLVSAGPNLKSVIPAREAASSTINNGNWYRQVFVSEEGIILAYKLYATVNTGVRAHSAILLRLREDGPFICVKANLPPAKHARYTALPVFEGRADVITPKEAMKLGAMFSPSFIKNIMDQEEVEEDFSVDVISPGAPKPVMQKVRTATGDKEVLVRPMSTRRIRVKR